MQDLIGYDEIIESSMRSVIKETFKKIAKTGLPGKHYFIVTFLTKFPGVVISEAQHEKHHEEMTIAIQHQFKGLVVEDEYFSISLSFNGQFENMTIPYNAVTSFSDPSMNFALKFSANFSDIDDLEIDDNDASNQGNDKNSNKNDASNVDLSAKVISLDAFRKNNNNSDHQ